MPYIQRDPQGAIAAIFVDNSRGHQEWLDANHPEVQQFMQGLGANPASDPAGGAGDGRRDIEQQLNNSDLEMVRVIEDVLELLIAKNLLMFTDLPLPAQQKLLARRQLRGQLGQNSSILLDEGGIL